MILRYSWNLTLCQGLKGIIDKADGGTYPWCSTGSTGFRVGHCWFGTRRRPSRCSCRRSEFAVPNHFLLGGRDERRSVRLEWQCYQRLFLLSVCCYCSLHKTNINTQTHCGIGTMRRFRVKINMLYYNHSSSLSSIMWSAERVFVGHWPTAIIATHLSIVACLAISPKKPEKVTERKLRSQFRNVWKSLVVSSLFNC